MEEGHLVLRSWLPPLPPVHSHPLTPPPDRAGLCLPASSLSVPRNSHQDCLHTPRSPVHQLSKTSFPRGQPLCRVACPVLEEGAAMGERGQSLQSCVSTGLGAGISLLLSLPHGAE